jgi:Uma2 family endonuclease
MATQTKRWTLEEVHSLPDDGNKYELVRGELFVTPPPSDDHETILARLSRLLEPYVAEHQLGFLYHPRAVLQFGGSEVEPDLMVRQPSSRRNTAWDDAPLPVLIVEVFSPSTRRRDQLQKRSLYMDAGIDEYWMIDPEREWITVVRPGRDDQTVRDQVLWEPRSGVPPLAVRLSVVFGETLEN